jgi:hypothetical protein
MDSWSGYSIAAVILVIIAIIMIIAGIVMLESPGSLTTATTPTNWWPWGLIIGGVILLIIGIIVGYAGRKPVVTSQSSSVVYHGAPTPGYGVYTPHHMYPPTGGSWAYGPPATVPGQYPSYPM